MSFMSFVDGFHIPEWTKDALCTQVDVGDAFYPDRGDEGAVAKRICSMCPVQAQCLEDALVRNEPEGIWGGLSPRQRQKFKRGEKVRFLKPPEEKPPTVCAVCGRKFRRGPKAIYCGKYCSNKVVHERQRQKRAERIKEIEEAA